MKAYREPCGCKHDGAHWLVLCEAHKAEWKTLHTQAAKDHAQPFIDPLLE